jgi:cytochrome c biogenesis protein CcdA
VVTIGGVPAAIATPIYRSGWLVDPIGGVILMLAGLVALGAGALSAPLHRHESVARRVCHRIFAAVLGGSTGVLMYHQLDPIYDSVFFSTGNAVAASHAPATIMLFTEGLGVAYLAAGGAVRALIARQSWGRRVALGGRALAGIATALLGLAMLTGRFGVVRGLLF